MKRDEITAEGCEGERVRRARSATILLPDEVLSFLAHDDLEVRRFAIRYLSEAHDPAPATADDLWAGFDRFRGDDRMWFSRSLSEMPSTPASYERILAGLRTEPHDSIFSHLCVALAHLSGDEVRRALAEPRIARQLAPVVRAEFDHVVHLAGLSFDDLWTLAETCTLEIKYERFLKKPSLSWVTRLAQALARFPEQAAGRALDVLLSAAVGRRERWLWAFAVKLLRYVRQPRALVPLLTLLGDGDAPYYIVHEWAQDALVHLGSREVVAAIAAGFPHAGGTFRWRASDVLGRIKRPESAQVLIRGLGATSDVLETTHLGVALCELCVTSPEVLDHLCDLVNAEHFVWHAGMLDEDLLVVCAMQGYQPVEAPAWRRRIADRNRSGRDG